MSWSGRVSSRFSVFRLAVVFAELCSLRIEFVRLRGGKIRFLVLSVGLGFYSLWLVCELEEFCTSRLFSVGAAIYARWFLVLAKVLCSCRLFSLTIRAFTHWLELGRAGLFALGFLIVTQKLGSSRFFGVSDGLSAPRIIAFVEIVCTVGIIAFGVRRLQVWLLVFFVCPRLSSSWFFAFSQKLLALRKFSVSSGLFPPWCVNFFEKLGSPRIVIGSA
jgi:hypothetical protein